jgi:hypothetical protein
MSTTQQSKEQTAVKKHKKVRHSSCCGSWLVGAQLENNFELPLEERKSKCRVSWSRWTRQGRQGGTEGKEEYCKVARIAVSSQVLFGYLR